MREQRNQVFGQIVTDANMRQFLLDIWDLLDAWHDMALSEAPLPAERLDTVFVQSLLGLLSNEYAVQQAPLLMTAMSACVNSWQDMIEMERTAKIMAAEKKPVDDARLRRAYQLRQAPIDFVITMLARVMPWGTLRKGSQQLRDYMQSEIGSYEQYAAQFEARVEDAKQGG